MSVTKIYTDWHDSGSDYVTPPQNYGPVTVPEGFTLVQAQWTGTISFPGGTITVDAVVEDSFVRGVQYVASGGTPLAIESSDKNKDQWLWLMMESGNVIDRVVWSNDNAEGNSIASKEFFNTWRGQRPLTQALDFYVSIGLQYSGSFTYRLYSDLTLWYSD